MNDQMNAQTGNHSKAKAIVGIIVLIVVVVLAVLWYKARQEPGMMTSGTQTAPKIVQPQLVTRYDVTSTTTTMVQKLPKGFPTDIPVESTLISSTSTLYPTQLTTLDAVSYTSAQTMQAKYAQYDKFLSTASNKFMHETKTASSTISVLQATRGATQLMVVITPQSTGSLVQLSLTIHQ